MRHLRSFAMVADELNVTRAASRLHLAQQAVSAHIRHLERVLGARLLIRTSRGVELTAAGKELAAGTSKVLGDLSELATRVREADEGRRGRLRLLCKPHATYEFAVEIAEAMETAIPGVAIELITVSTLPEELGLLRSGDADVCFLWLPVGAVGLSAEPVIIPAVVVSDDVLRHWLAEPRPDGRQAPRGPAAQRIEDRLMLVARGKGIWLAPEPLSRYFPMPKVTWLPVADAAPSDLAVVWTPQAPQPLVTRLVTEVRRITKWPGS